MPRPAVSSTRSATTASFDLSKGLVWDDQQEALHEHVAARRLQGSGHRRQRRRRSTGLPQRSAGRRARVRRAHRQAGLDVPHHPAARRVRQRHLAERFVELHRTHQRVGADDAGRGARARLPAGQHAEQRFLRRPAPRRESVRRVARLPRRERPACASGISKSCTTACGTTTSPAPPSLVTMRVDGRSIDAVVQLTKQGFAYVFDRVTGKPVWPIEERPGAGERRRRRTRVADAAVSDAAAARSPSRASRSTMRSISRRS